jgi:curved DNA-binding protein CbpA
MRDYNEYYLFLNASPQSSQADIDRAYQSVIGEARRQGGIMLDLVEEGYRCLADPTSRAQYHAGTYRQDVRVRIFRESNEREGRADQFAAFPRMKKIQFYQYIFDSDEVNVTFEMLPNGKFRNTKTGEIVDQI